MKARGASFPDDVARRIILGEERALARLLSALEDGEPWSGAALMLLRKDAASSHDAERSSAGEFRSGERSSPRSSHIIGITGSPGTGKSCLVDQLIGAYRERGERVAVLAVDPSSPFSGGAILGDRIRMQGSLRGAASAPPDEAVFIRSLASRGRLGGLSRATGQCARALEAAGYGVVLVETVGIGQSEVDIARLADSVVLVAMPGSGDEIQTIKAGVMEIGDIFVVNKADRPGADKAVGEIRAMLELGIAASHNDAMGHREFDAAVAGEREVLAARMEISPVLKTVAVTGEGVGELVAALDARWAALRASGELEAGRRRGAVAEARALLSDRVLAELEALEGGLEEELAGEIVRGELEAAQAADILFDSIRGRKGIARGGKR